MNCRGRDIYKGLETSDVSFQSMADYPMVLIPACCLCFVLVGDRNSRQIRAKHRHLF